MPPFVGVAVKVTLTPAHIELADAAMDTDGVTGDVTVMVIEFEVAVAVVMQAALLVITTFTTLLLVKVEEEKVLLLVPAFTPFTFH